MASTFRIPHITTFLVVIVFLLLGYSSVTYKDVILNAFSSSASVYRSAAHQSELVESYTRLRWEQLIPDNEKALLDKYQSAEPTNLETLSTQVLNSINAASDVAYQQALISTNTVDTFDGQAVEISGFIVPIEFHKNQDPKTLFFVPYFGACIHFPPPPPNQMFYIELEPGLSDYDMDQAYTIRGMLSRDLYEDPMGTSAYVLDVHAIETFNGQPDTYRQH